MAKRAAVVVGTALVLGAASITLMACYGCPDCQSGTYCPATQTYDYDDSGCPDAGRERSDASVADSGADGATTEDAGARDASDDADAAGDADVDASDGG